MSQEMENTNTNTNTNTNFNPNIHVENLCENHLFFRKKENYRKVNYKKQKKTKKIRVYDDSCKYYIKMTQQIHQIAHHSKSFYTYEKAEFLDLTKIENASFKKIALSTKSGMEKKVCKQAGALGASFLVRSALRQIRANTSDSTTKATRAHLQ